MSAERTAANAHVCPTCGGPLTVENFAEATISTGKCGYSWAAHFGGGEPDHQPLQRPVGSPADHRPRQP